MGSVYLGYQEEQKQHVAVKVLSDQMSGNSAYVERFYREAKSGALLNHANIVRCIEAGQDQATGKHYLILEYVDGQSAHALLERSGRLSVGDVVHIGLDIARALEHAHARNVVHRDIKPDNILITRSGIAKLSDLGLAKRMDETKHLTALHQGCGTLYYMPFEQVSNARHADGRSDIYALGATLYHLVTGQVPFPGETHLEIAEKKIVGTFTPANDLNAEVPAILDRIFTKMLARDPGNRYQMASELIVDLERSKLAAALPSFADPERALHDPLVQERLTPVPPTVLDMEGLAAQPELRATLAESAPSHARNDAPVSPPVSPAGVRADASSGEGEISAPAARAVPRRSRGHLLIGAAIGLAVSGMAVAAVYKFMVTP
jgi:serine/threonine-protein kinase